MSAGEFTPSKQPASGTAVFREVAAIIKTGEWVFPVDGRQYNGSGAPGRLLEDLLGIKENNADSPDLSDWEIKFHGGTSLLTLFHKTPEPKGIIGVMVQAYGWDDEKGRISFRHTISGTTGRGFYIVNEADRIIVRNRDNDAYEPYWTHNTLFNAFASKLRRLIVVEGKVLRDPRRVDYQKATAYWEPDIKGFTKAIIDGVFFIDFDARTQGGPGTTIRDHGTKFRIKIEDLGKVYANTMKIACDKT